MTLGIPGRAPSGDGPLERTTPIVRISRSALTTNLADALARSREGLVVDVRADAWGHGADVVAPLAEAAGAVTLAEGVHSSDAHGRAGDRTRWEDTGLDATVYGLVPGHTPAMRLIGRVLSVKRLKQGEGVSYGFSHRAPHDTMIALVTGGYAQGVVRALGNRAAVAIAGERHPIVGRVAMDVCVVDIGDARVERGHEVVFFGDPAEGHPALTEWQAATGMTAAELVTAVGLRNDREYVS